VIRRIVDACDTSVVRRGAFDEDPVDRMAVVDRRAPLAAAADLVMIVRANVTAR